jgi:hypothetical protein
MSDVEHDYNLMKMQLKIELNSLYTNGTPGRMLVFAKQARDIMYRCTANDASVARDCDRLIRDYIKILNNRIKESQSVNHEVKPSSMFSHNFFLAELYMSRPELVEELIVEYPFAFMYVGADWSAWTQLLK